MSTIAGTVRTNLTDEHGIDVVVFGERELDNAALAEAHLPHEGNRCAVGLLSDLRLCADGAARQRLILAAIRKAGFDWLCYWRIQSVGERVRQAAWFDTYSPPGWLECFRKTGLFDIDPRIGLARRRDWPFVWDVASLFANRGAQRIHPVARHFMERAAKLGVRSGVTIGLPTRHLSERAILTLSSARTDRRWVTDTAMGQAYALALAVHGFIDPRAQHLIARPDSGALNEIELAVLRFVSRGLSNREIAERLAVSIHVVAHHLRQLEQKCAARNRVQLAYMAGRILHE